MTHAKRLWSIWQALLSAFAWAFTRPSFRRFAEWITAMAINGEEHTITQSVLALERPADWKALESFAEYGAWHPDYVTASLTRLVETAPGRLWHGYHISAVDDTKVHHAESGTITQKAGRTQKAHAESGTTQKAGRVRYWQYEQAEKSPDLAISDLSRFLPRTDAAESGTGPLLAI